MVLHKNVVYQAGFTRSVSCLARNDFGLANCSMELSIDESLRFGQIEWLVRYRSGGMEAIYIDLQFNEKQELTDYDGIYPMPSEAKELIASCGFKLPPVVRVPADEKDPADFISITDDDLAELFFNEPCTFSIF